MSSLVTKEVVADFDVNQHQHLAKWVTDGNIAQEIKVHRGGFSNLQDWEKHLREGPDVYVDYEEVHVVMVIDTSKQYSTLETGTCQDVDEVAEAVMSHIIADLNKIFSHCSINRDTIEVLD